MSLAALQHAIRSTAPNSWVALGLVVAAFFALIAPMLADFTTYGFHDWDVETAYRYITVKSLKEYGEGPWWHPFLCGGVPAFGQVETASNLVSPYLPLYLLADIRTAIRLEVVGNGLIGLFGSYALAGRFTKSAALRALFALLTFLNGRWALQAAVGHTWHLQFAWTPWILLFFLQASEDGRLGRAVLAGACLAGLCFWGGIYPLPQTALFLCVIALATAAFVRSARPLVALAIAGATAVGLAAPKLFAVADQMQRLPRLIESKEVIGPAQLFVMLTESEQAYGTFPVRVPAYNWHEWGIYVGLTGLVVLGLGVALGWGRRERALTLCGVLCLLLGFGAFHPWSPWALLHRLPVFASQHVPSRFHYLMLFFLGLAAVGAVARVLDPRLARRPWLDLALLVPVALYAADLVRVNRVPFTQAFWMQAPATIPRAEPFEHRVHSPVHYLRRDWAAPMLLAMQANSGVIRCYGVDPALVPAAIPKSRRDYRGAAFVVDGPGEAKIVEWTPNRATVEVTGARPGAPVAYNMNYDPSWRANGEPALELRGLVAARASASNDRIEFRYFPRTFAFSLPLFGLTLALIGAGFVPSVRRRLRELVGRHA